MNLSLIRALERSGESRPQAVSGRAGTPRSLRPPTVHRGHFTVRTVSLSFPEALNRADRQKQPNMTCWGLSLVIRRLTSPFPSDMDTGILKRTGRHDHHGYHTIHPVCSPVGLVKFMLSRSICDAFVLVPGIRWVVKVSRQSLT